MRKFLLSMPCILLSLSIFAQGKVSVFILVFDSKATSKELNGMAELIYLDNKLKLNQFTIFHYSNKKEADEIWRKGKKEVRYTPVHVDCDFSVCNTTNTLLTANKAEKNKLFTCSSNLPCSIDKWNIEHTALASRSESSILNKIQEELSLAKSIKKDVSLFFYISEGELEITPTVIFPTDSIEIKADETVVINATFSKDVATVVWQPEGDLSCTNCRTPVLRATKSNLYTVTVTDSAKCKTTSKSLIVNVKSTCFCSSNSLNPIKDVLGSMDIAKYSNDVDERIADWQIASNQSGGYVFDYVCRPNCASKFKVRIEDSKGNKVWEEDFEKSEVDFRSRNDYHEICPECFVYRLNLANYKKLTSNEQFYTIIIYSYDDRNQECAPYKSPRLIFSKCN